MSNYFAALLTPAAVHAAADLDPADLAVLRAHCKRLAPAAAEPDLDPDDLAAVDERISVKHGEDKVRVGRRTSTYAELKAGELGLVVDSYGLVALVLDRGSAADELRLGPGTPIDLSTPQ